MLLGPLITKLIFYVFAIMTVASAAMVVFSRNAMRSILFLVLCFVSSAVLWILLQAEFLALILIFVYVGAVMTLFLFVVMMLYVDMVQLSEGFVRYLPYAALIMLALLGVLVMVYAPGHNYPWPQLSVQQHAASYSNTQHLGELLYTHYILSFELAGAILLTAIIAAISLAFFGRKANTRAQRIRQQLQANKQDCLRMVNLPSHTYSSAVKQPAPAEKKPDQPPVEKE